MPRFVVLAMLLVPAATGAAQSELSAALIGLAQAERQFAAAGARDGVQTSFLAHFAPDAILLRPFAIPAVDYYRAHADPPGALLWAPQYLAISAAGDLGVSSGPWRFETAQDGKPIAAHGNFFSIWRRGTDGRWQVVLDHGVSHAAPDVAVEHTALVALAGPGALAPDSAQTARRAALEKADDALRDRLAAHDVAPWAPIARADTLWLRDEQPPSRGPAPPALVKSACGCGPRVRLDVAHSGDLGYTVGGSEAQHDRGADVRVWQFDARRGWTLLADLSVG